MALPDKNSQAKKTGTKKTASLIKNSFFKRLALDRFSGIFVAFKAWQAVTASVDHKKEKRRQGNQKRQKLIMQNIKVLWNKQNSAVEQGNQSKYIDRLNKKHRNQSRF